MKKLPFYLTMSRIVLAPIMLLAFFDRSPSTWWFLCASFIALSITDYFDGKLARKYNVVSNFGKFFDPTGDKILVLFALVVLMHFKNASPLFLIVLMTRDIIIGSMRSYASSMSIVLAARWLGKLKTTLQMIAVPLMLAPELSFFPNYEIGSFFLWSACLISVISLLDYANQLKSLKIRD